MAAQEDIRFSLTVNGNTEFDVVSFEHKEHLSSLFTTTLRLASFDDNPVFADILDNPATLTLHQEGAPVRYINGIVTQVAQGKTGVRRTHYTMTIEPALKRCALTSDSRHFQNKTIVEIIQHVLEESGLRDVQFMELLTHPVTREFCQQYRETDLAFIQRLAAEEGFFYYFEHSEKQHILHFANNTQAANGIGNLLYNAMPSGDQPEPCLWDAQYQEHLAPTQMAMKDYTFTNPDYRLNHTAAMDSRRNEINQYERFDSPGRYKRDNAGKPFTQVRLEELRREAATLLGEGDDMRVVPGYSMNLIGHARISLNQKWVIIGVDHKGYQPGVLGEEADASSSAKGSRYENKPLMIPSTAQWRADTQHKPCVDGPQIATVVGPAGEEIYCDEWGRVKLQFEYDRYGKFDEHSSCWIRVSQGWAGTQYGGIAIPRIGQEVIVDFLEGDPDQPIVTGRTYNANNLPPYPLPANKTRMSIKSNTHKGSGFNELRFEDENDQEEVFIHAQKDQNNIVLNNETTEVGVDRTEHVGNDEAVNIGRDRKETIGNDMFYEVGRNQQERYGKDHIHNVGNIHKQDIGTDHNYEAGGHFKGSVGGEYTLEVGKSINNNTVTHILQAAERFEIKGPAGKIILDGSGITLEGVNINLKAPVSMGGSGSSEVPNLDLSFAKSTPICEECEKRKQAAEAAS